MNNHTINEIGIKQIAEQLKSACKPSVFDGWLEDDLIESRRSQEMLSAWATELEDTLNSGNGDEIEICQHLTNSGHVEWIAVTDEGIDVESTEHSS